MAPVDIPRRELYINGKWVTPQSNKRIPVICPYTETEIGTIPGGSAADVQAAVSAAARAFHNGPWSRLTGTERAGVLRNIADKVYPPFLAGFLLMGGMIVSVIAFV